MSIFLGLLMAVSYLLTGEVRRYALQHRLIDTPQLRSSHTIPTPRGGGMAIAISFLLACIWFWLNGQLSSRLLLGFAVGGGGVALVGFWDDHGHVPVLWRLMFHFAAGAWFWGCLGGFSTSWIGFMVTVVYLAWLLNLYNFMDGIDGIAGMEAVTVTIGGAILIWWLQNDLGSPGGLLLALCASVCGFLFWNFPTAKVFMGDAGSSFIGMTLGSLSLLLASLSTQLFWAWMILLGVFIVDATVTLIRRGVQGEKIYEPHHCHAYQFAARKLRAHVPVTMGVAAINLCWLLPMAFLVTVGKIGGRLGLLVAYLPLIVLAFGLGAGGPERKRDEKQISPS